MTVTAVTGEKTDGAGRTRPELSSIIVPVPIAGFTALPAYDKVGWHTSDTHPLVFDGVRVPEGNLLGERGKGFANFLSVLDEGRVAFAALCVGAAQGCLEQAVARAKQREVFGRAIGDNQHIAFTIARMQSRVAAARAVMHDAAHRIDAGMPFTKQASLAKLIGSRDGRRERAGRNSDMGRLRLPERERRRTALPRRPHPHPRRGVDGGAAGRHRPQPRLRARLRVVPGTVMRFSHLTVPVDRKNPVR